MQLLYLQAYVAVQTLLEKNVANVNMCIFKFQEIWELMVGSKTKDSINFPLFLTQSFQNTNPMDLFYDTFMFFFLSFRSCQSQWPFTFILWHLLLCSQKRESHIGLEQHGGEWMRFWLSYPFKDLKHIQCSHMVFLQCLFKVMFICRVINNRNESFKHSEKSVVKQWTPFQLLALLTRVNMNEVQSSETWTVKVTCVVFLWLKWSYGKTELK